MALRMHHVTAHQTAADDDGLYDASIGCRANVYDAILINSLMQDGWGRWQLGFHALFTMAANCPNLRELTISEEHLEVSFPHHNTI